MSTLTIAAIALCFPILWITYMIGVAVVGCWRRHCDNKIPYHYWIGWEDSKTGWRAYTGVLAMNPDEAFYNFRCNYPKRRILVCSPNIEIVRHRIKKFPWEAD